MPAECLPTPTTVIRAGLPRKRRSRAIGEPELVAMCELLAQRLTDTEACQVSGIPYGTWINWKSRNPHKVSDCLARTMGETIRENIQCIKSARSKDWRAARELLSIHAPERFNDRLNGAPQVQVNIMAGQQLTKIVSGVWSNEKARSVQGTVEPMRAIGPQEQAKAIGDKTESNPS